MALKMEYTLDNGIIGNYWRVIDINGNIQNKAFGVQFGLYITEGQARNNPYSYIYCKNFYYINEDFDNIMNRLAGNSIHNVVYNFVKAKEEFFADSIDI